MPELSGRPLLDNRADATLFVGRDRELAELVSAVKAGLNTVVVGPAGEGKTSLLRALMYQLRQLARNRQVVYVRAGGVTDPLELLRRIAAQLSEGGAPASIETEGADALLERLANRQHAPHTAVLIDDVTAAAGHGLFGRLRDQLWELGYVWVAAVNPGERAALLLPPADAFFERLLELGPLSADAVEQLLRTRLGSAPRGWAKQLAEAGGGNPRRVLDAVRQLNVTSTQRAGERASALATWLAASALRDRAIASLGRSEAMLAAALERLGSASASDEALLAQLGWTRPRAVQVLTRLEAAGLVRSDEVRSGPGRPRKVFRLTPPADYAVARDDAPPE